MPGAATEVGPLGVAIAEVLRGLAAVHGLDQQDFAAPMGVSRGQAWKLLNGQRPMNVDQLDGAAHLVGTTAGDVVRAAATSMAGGDVHLPSSRARVRPGRPAPAPRRATASDDGHTHREHDPSERLSWREDEPRPTTTRGGR